MKVLDLFSGIGGFSLGFERAGMTIAAFCERDHYCAQVLARHWPNVIVHNDIKNLDGGQYRNASLSAVPGTAEAQKMIAISGQKCFELYEKFGRLGLFAKMLLESRIWNSTIVFLTWKVTASKSKLLIYRLAVSAPFTAVAGSGLLPTPLASDSGTQRDFIPSVTSTGILKGQGRENGKQKQISLGQMMIMMEHIADPKLSLKGARLNPGLSRK